MNETTASIKNRSNIWRLILLLLLVEKMVQDAVAAQCTDCLKNIILGDQSKNITHGSSTQSNCDCQWIIPETVQVNDIAVVLVLTNASFLKDLNECSAKLRFPETEEYECDFKKNYCLMFATNSTVCNDSNVKTKIPYDNHTCTSFHSWKNKTTQIEYNLIFPELSKSFIIQYLVINCSADALSTALEVSSTSRNLADKSAMTTGPSTVGTQGGNLVVIIVPVAIATLLLIAIFAYVLFRYNKRKQSKTSKDEESFEVHVEPANSTHVEQPATYENYDPTTAEGEYEVTPTAALSYENLRTDDSLYENLPNGEVYENI
ncbi:uncharacterized protein LOC144429976 [Styela clava]